MSKKVIEQYVLVNNQALTGSFQSQATSLKYMDRCALSIICTGTPTGTVTVQTSVDNVTFFDLPLGLVGLAGGPQNYFIDIQETAGAWIRVKYVFSAGVGFMTATIVAKES